MSETPEAQLEPENVEQSSYLGKLAEALAKAQGEILNAKRDTANPFFKSKYADLAAIWEAARAALSKNGLAVIQTTQMRAGRLMLETTLAHSSGQWIMGAYPIKPMKDDPQSLGSAMTYARRYSLAAIVGVAPGDDDDGEAAMGRADQAKQSGEFRTALDRPENRTPPAQPPAPRKP